MVDIILILLGAVSIVTIAFAMQYYRQLRKAQKEYEKARTAVEDITFSFNRELKRDAQRLELVAYKVEEVAFKEDRALGKAEELEKQVRALQAQQSQKEEVEGLSRRIDQVDRKISDAITSQQGLTERITAIEQQAKQFALSPEVPIEGIIPIKRDRAIAQLTETELAVLEFLASDGAKAAPEIKKQVGLSREHTARLMKKLYEEGYLERDTNKVPFKYSVKKEMEKLLKKAENETPISS